MTALKVVDQIHFTDEKDKPKKTPQFIVAKEIELHTRDIPSEGANFNHLKGHKAIVNDADITQLFNLVSKDYKILQHDELYDMIETTIKDDAYKAKIETLLLNNGARLRVNCSFPDIKIQIGPTGNDDIVNLKMAFDNSYDATTGVRAMIAGVTEKNRKSRYLVMGDSMAFFYQRHTKGMDASKVHQTIEDGIRVFQTKVKEKFERYYSNQINVGKLKELMTELRDDKFISQKYLESMIHKLMNNVNVSVGSVTNQWLVYNLICEVMGDEASSLDVLESSVKKMDDKINAKLKDLA